MKSEVQKILLSSVATSLEFICDHLSVPTTNPKTHAPEYPELQELGRSFVSFYRKGKLAGCMGSLEPVRNLWEDVKQNTFTASQSDMRFSPIVKWQLPELKVGVNVLGGERRIPASAIDAEVEAGSSIVLRIPNTQVKAMLLNFSARETEGEAAIVRVLRTKAGVAPRLTDQDLAFYAVETIFFEEPFVNIPKLKLGV